MIDTLAFNAAPARNLGDMGRELGITSTQVDLWNAFAASLERLYLDRREVDARARGFAMDAPADVEILVDLRVDRARARLDALTELTQRTHALCAVLNGRQRLKANRLLQTLASAV